MNANFFELCKISATRISGYPQPTPDQLLPRMNSFAVGAVDGAGVGTIVGSGVGAGVGGVGAGVGAGVGNGVNPSAFKA